MSELTDQQIDVEVAARLAARLVILEVAGLEVPESVMAAALDAASRVYAKAEAAEVDRLMADVGFAGMDIHDGAIRMHIKQSAEIAAGMVKAFDALVTAQGCENYLEQDFTVTDPATEQAAEAGLPYDQWPPHRRYKFIIVKPNGRSPHELRRDAEARIAELEEELAIARSAAAGG